MARARRRRGHLTRERSGTRLRPRPAPRSPGPFSIRQRRAHVAHRPVHRRHAHGAAGAGGRPRDGRGVGEGGGDEPRRQHQGPHRAGHDRRRRAPRGASARRHHRGAHLGKHGDRAGAGGVGARLPADPVPSRADERGAQGHPARVRRRAGADRPRAAHAGRDRRGRAHPRPHRRLPPQPVLQPGQPAHPLRDHGPGDLGGDGRPHRRLRLRHGHGGGRSPARAAT